MDQGELEAGLKTLFAAQDREQLFAAVETHPTLLSDEALAALKEFLDLQVAGDDQDEIRMLNVFLIGCRVYGVEALRADITPILDDLRMPIEELLTVRETDHLLDVFEARPGLFGPVGLHTLAFLASHLLDPNHRRHFEMIASLAEATAKDGIVAVREQVRKQSNSGSTNIDNVSGDDDIEPAFDDDSWLRGPQGRAIEFAARVDGLLQFFDGREGLVWGSAKGIVAAAMLEAAPKDDPKWYDLIIMNFERALTKITPDNDPWGWSFFKGLLGVAYATRPDGNRADNLENALGCYLDALTIQTPQADLSAWTTMMHNLGSTYLDRECGTREDNLEQAIACYSRILSVITPQSDADSWAKAQTALGMAYFCRMRGAPTENVDRAMRCFDLAFTVLTPDRDAAGYARAKAELATGLTNICVVGDHDGNLQQAIDCYLEALEVYTPENTPSEWARAKTNLGNSYVMHRRGDRADNIEHAIACFKDALRIRKRRNDPAGWATTLCHLGAAYSERLRGDHAENIETAIEALEAGLEVVRETAHRRNIAVSLNDLGEAYRKRIRGDRAENIEKAIECFALSLALLDRETHSADWRMTEAFLGNAYTVRLHGDPTENRDTAIEHLMNARSVKSGDGEQSEINVLINLGAAYLSGERSDHADAIERAIDYFETALSRISRETNADVWAIATANLGAALVHRIRGIRSENIRKGIELLESALAIQSENSGQPGWAINLWNLGLAYLVPEEGATQGNLSRALECFRKARQAGGHFLRSSQLLGRYVAEARALLQSGGDHWPEAAMTLDDVMREFTSRRGEIVTSESMQEILAALSDVGRWSAIIEIADNNTARALEKLEASRGVALREALAVDELLLEGCDGAAKDAIKSARQRIANLRVEADIRFAPTGRRPYRDVAADLRVAQDELAYAIRTAGYQPTTSLTIGEILAAIPSGTALIVPIATEFGGAVFVVPGGTKHLSQNHVVNLPSLTAQSLRAQTSSWLSAYHAMMRAYHTDKAALEKCQRAASDALGELLDRLWRDVMGPALKRLAEFREMDCDESTPPQELLIMPTGDFALLPLHAAWYDHHGERRTVLDDFAVSYTPSLYAWRVERTRSKVKSSRGTLIAMINPTNDLTFGEQFEVPALERLFPKKAKILIGDCATKSTLRKSVSGHTYVHLSCHGRFDWLNPLGSGLVLAGGEQLSGPEIVADLELSACRWIVLSACETAMTDIWTTPEEAVGLIAAFQRAGASCVTASLWSVVDISTALFMTSAYEQHLIHKLSPAQAIRRAALWLRDLPIDAATQETDRNGVGVNGETHRWRFAELVSQGPTSTADASPSPRPFRSPLFWAPFTCWGM